MSRALMPNMLTPQDLEPNWEWRDRLPAWGHTSVDFERRIDHDRLRRYRLARTRQSLQASNAGSLLLFDVNNIRYVSATKIGEWERDKMCRFCLLTGDDSPMSGTSARPPCTTSAIPTGWSPTTASPASSACAARSRPSSA
jgi:Xaa-Pro aminopeptidase